MSTTDEPGSALRDDAERDLYASSPRIESAVASRASIAGTGATPSSHTQEEGHTIPRSWSYSFLSAARRGGRSIVNWVKGPVPAERQKISPLFPRVQTLPLRLLQKYLPKQRHKLVALIFFYFCWLLTFVTVLHHSAFSGEIEGYGAPAWLPCVASYW